MYITEGLGGQLPGCDHGLEKPTFRPVQGEGILIFYYNTEGGVGGCQSGGEGHFSSGDRGTIYWYKNSFI